MRASNRVNILTAHVCKSDRVGSQIVEGNLELAKDQGLAMEDVLVEVNKATQAGSAHLRQSNLPKDGYETKSHIVFSPPSRRMTADDFKFMLHGGNAKEADFMWVVITDPEDAQRILKNHIQKVKTTETAFTRKGVLTRIDVDEWSKQRKQIIPAFGIKSLRKLMPLMNEGAKNFVAHVDINAKEGTTLDISEALHEQTFGLIASAALGESTEFIDKYNEEIRTGFDDALSIFDFRNKAEGKKTAEMFDSFADDSLSSGRSGNGSFSPTSLAARLMDDSAGNPYKGDTDLQMDELLTFMFAGHDTTASTLSWLIYELARNPDIQAKVQKEVDATLVKLDGRQLEYRDITKMRYTTKVINETLRLWPVVPQGPRREMMFDDTIKGPDGKPVTVKKGTIVHVPHWLLHRNKKLWGDDVLEFKPDRMGDKDFNKNRAFMPFTRPPRDCIGRNFAMMEMRTLVLYIFGNYDVALENPSEVKQGDAKVVMKPENGVRVRLATRANATARAKQALTTAKA
jgi:cytochrome P450